MEIKGDTLLHYADSLKFSANSAVNDYMQRVEIRQMKLAVGPKSLSFCSRNTRFSIK